LQQVVAQIEPRAVIQQHRGEPRPLGFGEVAGQGRGEMQRGLAETAAHVGVDAMYQILIVGIVRGYSGSSVETLRMPLIP